MMYPMFSALSRVSKAMPITLSSCRAGPPLFPLFIAASICKRKGTQSEITLLHNSGQFLMGNFQKRGIFADKFAIILVAPLGNFTTVSQRSHKVSNGSNKLHIVTVTICFYGYVAFSKGFKRHGSSVVSLVKLTRTNQIFKN